MTHNFGVLDVNIPEHITISDYPPTSTLNPHLDSTRYASTSVSFSDQSNDLARRESERLATYLWENYIEPYDFKTIFLIGAGNAFHGIAKLLSENDSVYERITAAVAFISENPVRVVSNPNNPWVSNWYRDNSRVYVAADHQLWTKDKVSKRYGGTVRGPAGVETVNGLMQCFHDEVWEWIGERVRDYEQVEAEDDEDDDNDDSAKTESESEDAEVKRENGVGVGTGVFSAALEPVVRSTGVDVPME